MKFDKYELLIALTLSIGVSIIIILLFHLSILIDEEILLLKNLDNICISNGYDKNVLDLIKIWENNKYVYCVREIFVDQQFETITEWIKID